MKSKILLIILTMLFSFNTFANLGRESGGGNILGGKMVESYIIDPMTLSDADALNQRLLILKEKNIDLYTLIKKGLNKPTWYFIPGALKELSENITGIPFVTDQIAIQNFKTNEIWIDQSLYSSEATGLINSTERQKLLVHEAIMGEWNTSFIQAGGNILSPPANFPGIVRDLRLKQISGIYNGPGSLVDCNT